MTNAWSELLGAALVGSGRRAPAPPDDGTPLARLVDAVPGSSVEARLLGQAAAVALAQRAAALPPAEALPSGTTAPRDDRPVCSSAALALLTDLLEGPQRALLPEWLSLLAAAEQRVPAGFLPALLDLGARHGGWRGAVAAVIGPRGRWLAAQNPAWQYGAVDLDRPETLARHWVAGDEALRGYLLAELRARGRNRDERREMARRLLADAWPACNTRERARFLRALGPEVAPDDEPLLEQALDDRAHQVRREAITQLARLPGSAFAARMAARAADILDYVGEGETGRFLMASTLPEDAEMSRDGLRKTNGESKLRSWQLVNVISATPLSLWTERWRTSPEAIVAALTHGDQRQQLLPAFVLAARSQRDAAWAAPLLRFLGRRFWGRIDNYDLVSVLPRAQQETFLNELVAQHSRRPRPIHRTSPVLAVLGYLDRPWSRGLARTVLSFVAEGLQADPGRHRPDAMRQKAVHDLGRWLPVDLASADVEPIRSAVADSPWLDTVDQVVATWQLRRELARAFHFSEEQKHE